MRFVCGYAIVVNCHVNVDGRWCISMTSGSAEGFGFCHWMFFLDWGSFKFWMFVFFFHWKDQGTFVSQWGDLISLCFFFANHTVVRRETLQRPNNLPRPTSQTTYCSQIPTAVSFFSLPHNLYSFHPCIRFVCNII